MDVVLYKVGIPSCRVPELGSGGVEQKGERRRISWGAVLRATAKVQHSAGADQTTSLLKALHAILASSAMKYVVAYITLSLARRVGAGHMPVRSYSACMCMHVDSHTQSLLSQYHNAVHSAYPILTNTKVSGIEDRLLVLYLDLRSLSRIVASETTSSFVGGQRSFVPCMVAVMTNFDVPSSILALRLARIVRHSPKSSVSQGDALMLRHPVLGAPPTL